MIIIISCCVATERAEDVCLLSVSSPRHCTVYRAAFLLAVCHPPTHFCFSSPLPGSSSYVPISKEEEADHGTYNPERAEPVQQGIRLKNTAPRCPCMQRRRGQNFPSGIRWEFKSLDRWSSCGSPD